MNKVQKKPKLNGQGDWLKKIRANRKVKQMAKIMGISPRTYYHYENEEREISKAAKKLLEIEHGAKPEDSHSENSQEEKSEINNEVSKKFSNIDERLNIFDRRLMKIEEKLAKLINDDLPQTEPPKKPKKKDYILKENEFLA
jgi:transcriptional regulator with XRE-family HTH domain